MNTTELQSQMQYVVSLVDDLHRKGGCGEQLKICIASLKEVVEELLQLLNKKSHSVNHFVTHETPFWFQRCEEFYCALYLRVYSALDKSRRPSLSSSNTPLKASGVPIDPQCALNIIDIREGLPIKMSNDNETLAKFPPSSLFNVPGIHQKVHELEEFYEAECERLHDTYLKQYEALQTDSVEWECIEKMRRQIALIDIQCQASGEVQPMWNCQCDSISNALHLLCDTAKGLMKTERAIVKNCIPYKNNVIAKFMVAVQLKDNMLKSYYLTKSHQKSLYAASAL